MLEFYEPWGPTAEGRGLGPAEALRRAQQHVRTHAEVVWTRTDTRWPGSIVPRPTIRRRWEHPYDWGVWVPWGRGD